ncbi:hypothetical protein E4631_24205 [Hymenobacter sp. UV11]|uniref:hypothetical protein n=1 Tax=Hymenobacter sp. UV11 TaxID=1849735 RepID=UPI0010606D02|nr:hypothetical protein [Hymenobacter sp. UV11]TDN39149.1 hypothetical protein A8B98_20435 [Hymenobacter sp. UV11]TFZ62918.1 hypothetical protein E4631_24205 [Hymenobacter sp. UV11]
MSVYKSILPANEYENWIKNWEKMEHRTGPFNFFMHEGKVQTGVIFHFNSLRYLFSTTGVVTIKVRFGLSEPGGGRVPQFHLVLFGVDSQNTIITPYFTSSSFTHHHHYSKDVTGEGNLPRELMRLWKKSWHKNVEDGIVNKHMFFLHRTNGGFLKGYNYALKEIMDAVGSFTGTSDIHIKFGLHKYYALQEKPESELAFVHTFGLILYAGTHTDEATGSALAPNTSVRLNDTTSSPSSTDGDVIDESGYYDFSAPCPFTC